MLALVLCIALAVSFLLTPIARAASLRFGVIDRPNLRKVHTLPTPRLGGLAMYLGAVLSCLFVLRDARAIDPQAWNEILGMFAGATVVVLFGVLDDRLGLRSQVKLFVAMPLATLFLVLGGVRVTAWPGAVFLKDDPLLYLICSWGVTLLWVCGVTAAISIFDYMDGLCSGIVAIASAFFLFFAVTHDQNLVATLAAAMLGVTTGFLFWNFNPARIFMGDCGAMFVGFMMATLGIKMRFAELPDTQSWMIPVLVLGVPLFDSGLVTVSRLRRGLVPFSSPGMDHTAHRLANLGLGHRGAVLILYWAAIVLGFLAMLTTRLSVEASYALISLVAVTMIVAVIILENFPYEKQPQKAVGSEVP